MDTGQNTKPQTITHVQWLEILDQCLELDEGSGVRREDIRKQGSVIATVGITDDQGNPRRLLASPLV